MVEQVHPLRSDYVGTQIRRHPMSSHPLCHSSVQKHYQFFAFFSKNGNIFRYWPHRLTVRTSGFQSENRGSIPREVTKARTKEVDCSTSFGFCEGGDMFFREKQSSRDRRALSRF